MSLHVFFGVDDMGANGLSHRSSFFGFALSISVLVGSASAQTERVELYVDDPRPVAEAVLALTMRYPKIVTYEDPRYAYAGDLLDVTDQIRRNPSPGAPRTLVPRGGVLQLSYDVAQATREPVNFAETLAHILEVNNLSPTGGRFALNQDGDLFHIVPAEVRNSQGHWIKQASILDTPVTIASEGLNGYNLIEVILQKVGEANGVSVGLAVERFTNTFFRFSGRVDARNEPARDVLLRTLHAISDRFTYLLLYDPSGKYYVLNVAVAAQPLMQDVSPEPRRLPRDGDPTPAGGFQQ